MDNENIVDTGFDIHQPRVAVDVAVLMVQIKKLIDNEYNHSKVKAYNKVFNLLNDNVKNMNAAVFMYRPADLPYINCKECNRFKTNECPLNSEDEYGYCHLKNYE